MSNLYGGKKRRHKRRRSQKRKYGGVSFIGSARVSASKIEKALGGSHRQRRTGGQPEILVRFMHFNPTIPISLLSHLLVARPYNGSYLFRQIIWRYGLPYYYSFNDAYKLTALRAGLLLAYTPSRLITFV